MTNGLVVYGAQSESRPIAPRGQPVTIDGVTVRCGLAPHTAVSFDPALPENARRVLVSVHALSCNYRDRAFIRAMRDVPAYRYSAFGSEFMGEVAAVGCAVGGLKVGDRVMADHEYLGARTITPGVRTGVATNQSSRPWQVHAEDKLARVPATMSDEEAAAFSLGAQTAYSMVRKLELQPDSHVLVLGASSNTSLFVLQALRPANVRVYAVTTSRERASRFDALGVQRTICTDRGNGGLANMSALEEAATAIRGFDAVVDPFFDLHIASAVRLLKPFGRYITCGLVVQNEHLARETIGDVPIDLRPVLYHAMINNLTIIANCLGRHEDLATAVREYGAGRVKPVIDSVYDGERGADFLDRTYNARDRFGKVVFKYS